jgi:chromosome segregation ATPase
VAYTLGQAAKAADVSKTTIQRAIKSGRLSASRQEDGSYVIDPAELHRAFPRDGHADGEMKQSVTLNATRELRVEVEMLRERIGEKDATIEDLRRRLDQREEERRQVQTRLMALLTDQRPAPQPAVRRGWWRFWR